MEIIDSQIHVWQANTPEHPWPEGMVSLQGEPFSYEQALQTLDEGGVDRAILVPPSWVGAQNHYVLEAHDAAPDRFAVMGRLDPHAPDARQQLRGWRDRPGMLGIRLLLNTDQTREYVTEPDYDWFWSQCQEDRIPLMCFTPGNAALLGRIAERYPDLQIIADHAARNPRGAKDEAAWEDIDALLGLGRFRNVAVKVSSLPCFSTDPFPFPVLHAPIRAIYDAFGADRMIWGSDATRLEHPYKDNVRLFTEALDFLSTADVEWIMGKSVRRWCNWPADQG